jgi:shikimate kinase
MASMDRQEFDDAMRDGRLRMAFVGMSNVGKTTRAAALKRSLGFEHIDIDTEICAALGVADLEALAAWMGYPDSDGYKERERRYLEIERGCVNKERTMNGNAVLDTTGSVIHLDREAQQELQKDFFVVHLDAGEEAVEALATRYFQVPKPVVWEELFEKKPEESTEEALRRSYPALLHERLERFRSLAHVSIPALVVPLNDGKEIIDTVRSYLLV